MTPVDCGSCGAQVLVRKASWEQTSVQWSAEARQRCHDLDRSGAQGRESLPLCPLLRASIETAVRHGDLPVLTDPGRQ
jgi:hypothetical protein